MVPRHHSVERILSSNTMQQRKMESKKADVKDKNNQAQCQINIKPIRSCLSMKSLHDKDRKVRLNKNVSFNNVQIRLHGVELGDNPSCTFGPPLTLGWEMMGDEFTLALDDYENHRPERLAREEMFLLACDRRDILNRAGYTDKEMRIVMREIKEIQNLRSKSANSSDKLDSLRLVAEKMSKRFKRLGFTEERKSRDREVLSYVDASAKFKRNKHRLNKTLTTSQSLPELNQRHFQELSTSVEALHSTKVENTFETSFCSLSERSISMPDMQRVPNSSSNIKVENTALEINQESDGSKSFVKDSSIDTTNNIEEDDDWFFFEDM